jgi:hypothetical protein
LPLDHRREPAVRGGDDSDIHPPGSVAADAFHGQVLDDAKQLGLRRQRQVRHFVEKQRTAVGVLELPAAPSDACSRPLFDAEEFGLEQGFDQRGAVDGHERTVRRRLNSWICRATSSLPTPLPLRADGEIGAREPLDANRAGPSSRASIRSGARLRRALAGTREPIRLWPAEIDCARISSTSAAKCAASPRI